MKYEGMSECVKNPLDPFWYVIISVVIAIIGIVVVVMWGLPKYNVWCSELQGRAEFVRAEQNRQIKIEEAKANLEAEKLNAMAEVERAKGAAEAIRIENGSITPNYIRYLWVRQQNMQESNIHSDRGRTANT